MAALPARGRRGVLRGHEPGEPERKRVCKPLDTVASEDSPLLVECPMGLDSKQKISSDCSPWHAKTKQNAGGHFSHIVGF